MFNLIDEKWIPVICRSGNIRMIAPWEISDSTDEPIKLMFGRPDMNSAVTQFLIGLVQTAMAPEDDDAWLDMLESIPSPEQFKNEMMRYHDYFELIDEKQPFMQETNINDVKDVFSLLIGSPGENTLKLNKDFFIKRINDSGSLCLPCTAAALYTMQSMAPQGGSGYKSSLRGGSPLTTMVEGSNLAISIILNLIPKNQFELNSEKTIFPWTMKPMESVQPTNNHAAMVFWATPRRICLNNPEPGECMICKSKGMVIKSYNEVNKGSSYIDWKHPLCPYYQNKENKLFPVATKTDLGHLNQWTSLAYTTSPTTHPAAVILHLHELSQDVEDILGKNTISFWMSGYENKSARIISWKDAREPLIINRTEKEKSNMIANLIGIVKLTEYGEKELDSSIKRMMKYKMPSMIDSYWNLCDLEFNRLLPSIPDSEYDDLIKSWSESVRNSCIHIFDELAELIPLDRYSDASKSRALLMKQTRYEKMIQELNKQ